MLRDHVFKLLKDIDSIECELRHLESKLTSVRVTLRRELLHDRDAAYVIESEQKMQEPVSRETELRRSQTWKYPIATRPDGF